MTTWACVSPSVTILIMAAMLLLGLVCYYVMDKKHLESPSPPTDEHAGVEYTVLNTQGNKLSTKKNSTSTGSCKAGFQSSMSQEETSVTRQPQAQARFSENKIFPKHA